MIEVAQLLLTLGGNPVKCSPDGMSALELLDVCLLSRSVYNYISVPLFFFF